MGEESVSGEKPAPLVTTRHSIADSPAPVVLLLAWQNTLRGHLIWGCSESGHSPSGANIHVPYSFSSGVSISIYIHGN